MDDSTEPNAPVKKTLTELQRRILGVLVEKARTTPDSYPLSLNGLVTGCNQKSNRAPLMSVTAEEVEDELMNMRDQGMVAEVHGGGRVPKYRHYMSDYIGVKGAEAGVLTELLLRGEQSVGDLRSRASRFGAIADQGALQEILRSLMDQQLVVALTPPGRGQLVTHNLYEDYELQNVQAQVASGAVGKPAARSTSSPAPSSSELETLRQEIAELKETVANLSDRVRELEN
ncbi:MAG: DUF480 domain-containing protein [Planctomycetota bacterium]